VTRASRAANDDRDGLALVLTTGGGAAHSRRAPSQERTPGYLRSNGGGYGTRPVTAFSAPGSDSRARSASPEDSDSSRPTLANKKPNRP
jgi:hypothetical protein